MIAVVGIICVGNHIGWHRRWLDYRFLTERLRAGMFLAFAAKEFKQNDAAHWPMNRVNESWTMMYFKNLWNKRPHAEATPDASLPVIKHFILHAWLDDQNRFHKSKSRREQQSHKLISRTGELFYGLTLF